MTFATLATPIGSAGIATVLVAGDRASRIVATIFRSRSADPPPFEPGDVRLGVIVDDGETLDEVLVVRSPDDGLLQTRDEYAIHGHGGRVAIERVLECVAREGASVVARSDYVAKLDACGEPDARHGELRLDATRALLEAETPRTVEVLLAQRAGALMRALDAIETELSRIGSEPSGAADALRAANEQLAGLVRRSRSGIALIEARRVVLAGATNAGKSSLFNALVRTDRVITSEQRGTTRDTIEARLDLAGYPVVVVDTPGLDEFDDEVGRSGVERARRAIAEADVVVFLFDGSRPADDRDRRALDEVVDRRPILVRTKADRPASPEEDERFASPDAVVSAETGYGLRAVDARILERAGLDPDLDPSAGIAFRPAHLRALERAATAAATLYERVATTGTVAPTAPAAIAEILAEIRNRCEKTVKKLPTRGDRER